MKKLAIWLAMLPLAALADMAPMSRAEWEQARQFSRMFTQPTHSLYGYALVGLVGVVLIVGLIVLAKRYPRNWNDFQERWIMLAILILSACVIVELFFGSFSRYCEEESYEEYLFYERHCRTCDTELRYLRGYYCPKCEPNRDKPLCNTLSARFQGSGRENDDSAPRYWTEWDCVGE